MDRKPRFKNNKYGTTDFIMYDDGREVIYENIKIRTVERPFHPEPNPYIQKELFLTVGFNVIGHVMVNYPQIKKINNV